MTERYYPDGQSHQEQERSLGRILITGALGKVGSVLTEGLASKFDIVTLDNRKRDNKTSFVADIANKKALTTAFANMGHIDGIIHLAANPDDKAPKSSVKRNNFLGTENVYECAREFGVPRIVFASSTHIFGRYPEYPNNPSNAAISVDAARRPDGWYGLSKGYGEDLARYYHDEYGIETIAIRIGALWENDTPEEPYDKLWLSHRDAVQVFEKALTTPIGYGAYFGISLDPSPIFDTKPTKRDLGFDPKDKTLPKKY